MTTSFTLTSTLEILSTNLATTTITGTNVTTLTLGLGASPAANMPSFVSKTIVITAPTADQINGFVTGAQVNDADTISTVAPALPAS